MKIYGKDALAHVEQSGIPFDGLNYQDTMYTGPKISLRHSVEKLFQKIGVINEPSSSPRLSEFEVIFSCADGLTYTARFFVNSITGEKSKPKWGIWDHYEKA